MEEMLSVPCTIMRGGTSKGIFFLENDVPRNEKSLRKFLLAAFGSPDKRQIDGLGGADPLTSKCAIIGPPTKEGADVNYSFYSIGIDSEVVEPALCGNISAAVGPFAIDKSLVRVTDPLTKIRVYNPHTDGMLTIEVETQDGKPVVEGNYKIDGVPGTGSKIILDWKSVSGGTGKTLLPTGNTKDNVLVEGIGEISMSIINFINTYLFVKANEIGLTGTELPLDVDSNEELLNKLEIIRGTGAEIAGLIKDRTKSREQCASDPLLIFVAPPRSYSTYSGERIRAGDIDIVARAMYMQVMHKTFAGSGALNMGVAAGMEGTIVNEVLKPGKEGKKPIIIGHPGGIMEVEAEVAKIGKEFVVKSARTYRTARKIMDGYVYVKRSRL